MSKSSNSSSEKPKKPVKKPKAPAKDASVSSKKPKVSAKQPKVPKKKAAPASQKTVVAPSPVVDAEITAPAPSLSQKPESPSLSDNAAHTVSEAPKIEEKKTAFSAEEHKPDSPAATANSLTQNTAQPSQPSEQDLEEEEKKKRAASTGNSSPGQKATSVLTSETLAVALGLVALVAGGPIAGLAVYGAVKFAQKGVIATLNGELKQAAKEAAFAAVGIAAIGAAVGAPASLGIAALGYGATKAAQAGIKRYKSYRENAARESAIKQEPGGPEPGLQQAISPEAPGINSPTRSAEVASQEAATPLSPPSRGSEVASPSTPPPSISPAIRTRLEISEDLPTIKPKYAQEALRSSEEPKVSMAPMAVRRDSKVVEALRRNSPVSNAPPTLSPSSTPAKGSGQAKAASPVGR